MDARTIFQINCGKCNLAEFETARQFGRILDGNRQAGGWMVHAELKCRPGFL